jgi:hypothetical protein
VGITLGSVVVGVVLSWYFTIVYAPYIKLNQKNYLQKSQIPSIPRSTLDVINPGVFGLNGGFGPLHKAAESDDVGKVLLLLLSDICVIGQLKGLLENRSFYFEGALEGNARRTSRLGSVSIRPLPLHLRIALNFAPS